MQDDEIIRISDTMGDFHFTFQKVIELVHVNVHQKLARKITQRQAYVRPIFGVETPDHFAQKQDRVSAPDMFFQNISQYLMIDIGEEFSDIAFQNPDCPRMITRDFPSLIAEAIYRSVRAFDAPTRVRVENKLRIEGYPKFKNHFLTSSYSLTY